MTSNRSMIRLLSHEALRFSVRLTGQPTAAFICHCSWLSCAGMFSVFTQLVCRLSLSWVTWRIISLYSRFAQNHSHLALYAHFPMLPQAYPVGPSMWTPSHGCDSSPQHYLPGLAPRSLGWAGKCSMLVLSQLGEFWHGTQVQRRYRLAVQLDARAWCKRLLSWKKTIKLTPFVVKGSSRALDP